MRRALAPIPLAVLACLAALIGLLAYGLAANGTDRVFEEGIASGRPEPAPAIELPRLSGGGRGSLADYRGELVVLNFWASWCEPCRTESPLLERWHRRIARDGGGTVVGVSVEDLDSDARAFVADYALSFPMLRDGEGATKEPYGIVGLPETFVLDRAGRVVAVRRGPVDDHFMREQVAPRLREPA